MYAERKGWALTTIDVDVRYDVGDDGLATIERTVALPVGLLAAQRQRLGEIAERTPVTLVIRRGTPITTTLEAG